MSATSLALAFIILCSHFYFLDYIKNIIIYKIENYLIYVWFVGETMDYFGMCNIDSI